MVPPDNKALTAVLSEHVDFMGLYAQTDGGVVRDDICMTSISLPSAVSTK